MKARHVAKGMLSYIPGALELMPRRGTGGTDSAEYCYGVWLKHLAMLWQNGLERLPAVIAELGPGDSLGTGLAAVLSGIDTYYALDVVRYSDASRDLRILDELVELFQERRPRPTRGWPDFDQYLNDGLFPGHILTADVLERALAPRRVAAIRSALLGDTSSEGVCIRYMVPWCDPGVISSGSVEVVISHSVLEHVDDLETTYRALAAWLAPSGLMSHQVDFDSHGLSEAWNGYRAYSELLWTIARGKRPFLINRQPCSVHLDLVRQNGFEVTCSLQRYRDDGIARGALSSRWQSLSDDDLNCCELFFQARRLASARGIARHAA